MVTLCKDAIDAYLSRLEAGFECHLEEDGSYTLVLPALRLDNDAIELSLARLPDGRIRISDSAETVDHLYLNGMNTNTRFFLNRLRLIALRHGVAIEGGEIRLDVEPEGLGEGLVSVTEAVRDAAYFLYARPKGTRSTFDDRVERALIARELQYDLDKEIAGSKDVHRFRFFLNSRYMTAIQPLATTTEASAIEKAQRFAYRILDIRNRTMEYRFAAILDDSPSGISASQWDKPEVSRPLANCDHVVLWSRLDESIPSVLPGYRAGEVMQRRADEIRRH